VSQRLEKTHLQQIIVYIRQYHGWWMQPSLFPEEGPAPPPIFSIGHSTRKLEELIWVLKHFNIETLVDIRHFPASRHNPQFNKPLLEQELANHGLHYVWLEQLGGFRTGGYLAYMESPEFAAGIRDLEDFARHRRTAFMCAEIKWFQCHRRHVSDALAAKGWSVTHIFTEKRADPHVRKTNRIKCD
jgi:uncharacterized protein (DUF488 family)